MQKYVEHGEHGGDPERPRVHNETHASREKYKREDYAARIKSLNVRMTNSDNRKDLMLLRNCWEKLMNGDYT